MVAQYLVKKISKPEDRQKFEALYCRYSGLLYHIAYGVLKDSQLTEDAVQMAYLTLIKNLYKVSTVESPSTAQFLIVIARNTAYQMYRQEKKVVSSDFEEYEVPDTRDIVADAESRETYREVVACIQSMKPVYAEVLHYKFLYGMSDQEIAKALHISVENARVRIHRARKKLKAIVKEKLENGEL